MKKIIAFITFIAIIANLVIAQPEADVAIENPRIIGNTFNFDIYIKRNNDHASWFTNDSAMLGGSSWWFTFNLTDMATTYNITYTNPVLFPAGAGYTHSVNNIGGVRLAITTVLAAVPPPANTRNMVLNRWYKMLTISALITGNSSNSSNINWDQINSALTTVNNVSNYPTTWYDSDCNIILNTKSWTGAVSTDWDNANNWSPSGVPSGVDIIYPNDPQRELSGFSISPYGTVQNLRINHLATMTIPQSTGLTVTGDVVLKGGMPNLILDAGFNAGTLSSAFIPEGDIDYNGYVIEPGHIEVHRTLYYTATTAGYYMHYVAAPVANVQLGDWDMIHGFSYAYEFRTSIQDWWNIHVVTRPTDPGYGFLLSLFDQPTATTQDVVFYDNLVLTDNPVSFSPDLTAGQYALIGNPYTAPIDWDLMNPQANITNTSWIWNPASQNYVTYTGGSGGNSSARYIQPGQSFFIQASGTVSSFSIQEADRVQSIQPYLKSGYTNLLRMYTEGGNETYDETYIRFKEGEVTGAYDLNHDGDDWPSAVGEFATEIYTMSTDGYRLAVDARPQLTAEQTDVPLYFKPAQEGEYSLFADAESMESFAGSIRIYLEDTFIPGQEWHNLRENNAYTFTSSPNDDLNRFILHFYDAEFGIDDDIAVTPVRIYSSRTDAIIINESEQLIREIHVYDITGNLMASRATVNDDMTRIFVSDNTGYYVVKVITDKAVYSEKVLISK